MDRSARAALPSSYSKTSSAFWAGAAVTRTTGLGGKRFVNFHEPHACVIALIPKHGSKRTPSRVQNGLCLSSLCEGGRVHIADAIKVLRIDGWQIRITKRRESCQAQVNPQTSCWALEGFWLRQLSANYADVQIPVTATVFGKASPAQLEITQAKAVPKTQPAPRKVDLTAAISDCSDLERDPAQRAPCTTTSAPCEPDFSISAAMTGIPLGNFLDRLDRQIQSTFAARDAFEEGPELKARQETPLGLEHLDGEVITIIEDILTSRARLDSHVACLSFTRRRSTRTGAGAVELYICTVSSNTGQL
jgi:hypothetical protein